VVRNPKKRLNSGNGMAQANLAREPSMEEILASIRKIIESNDTADAQRKADEDLAKASAGDDEADGPEEPSKAELETPSPSLTAVVEPAPISEPESPQAEAVSDAPPQADAREMAKGTESESYAAERVALTVELESARTGTGTPGVSRPPGSVSSPPETDVQADAAADGAGKTPATETLGAEVGQGLISPQAGERVARSFETLNHAVTHGPSRSFDEIAQDMLRPILRQWMDDNLPGLVEQLVREEIERVVHRR